MNSNSISSTEVKRRLEELGIELTAAPDPVANYVSVQYAGDLMFLSGAGPFKDGRPAMKGRLGEDMTIEEGYEAARLTGINLLAILDRELKGEWDRIEQVVKVQGFVRCTPDFEQQPRVINGVSDLLCEVLGDRGRHARTALGVTALPFAIPVEAEMIVKIKKS
ncbi:MAG: RidA family protein [Lachnospiraceae bacterium]|nr:RidA family protein [Lachnospiraceae bacterium]